MQFTADNSFLIKYKEKCALGEIVIGKELYLELRNLEKDMKNDEYIYDTYDSDIRIEFVEKAIKLTKSPFYGKRMKLLLWQKALIEAMYSFKMAKELIDNGEVIDRFKKIILLIARKNGKSELCSALGNAEFILGNKGSDLVCSSNDDAQASIVYDSINAMRQMYDTKDKFTQKKQRFILNKTNNTKIFKLSDRTRCKEGYNIDWSILDETHQMKDNVIAKSIEQSQSMKKNPKLINISTEGFIDGYLSDELKKARAIIKGEDDSISSKRILPWLYTQDSENEVFTNDRTWTKSNPSLHHIKKYSYLEEQIDLAKKNKADRIFVLSKDFNIRQSEVESWLNREDYTYDAKFDIKDFENSYCLGHVDLAETTDLCCAKIMLMKNDSRVKYIYTKYFIPESKLDPANDDHNAGAKYKDWIKQGLIDVCEGNDIDLSFVADWFYNLKKMYNITLYKCGYDQRFSRDWIKRMEEYGWSKKYGDIELVLQNSQTLNNAILLCEADFKAKYINYNENEVDKWCLSNACLKLNNIRQAIITKINNSNKIDGAVTLVSLYEMYRRYRNDFKKLNGGDVNGMVQ